MRSSKLDLAVLGMALATVPMGGAIVVYLVASPTFLSAPYAPRLSLTVGGIAFISFLLLFTCRLKANGKWRRRGVLPIAVSFSALMGFLWFLGFKEPVLFVLHLASERSFVQVSETAKSNELARACPDRISFPSPGLSARIICKAPKDVVHSLSHGGRVVLSGEGSRFGTSVERFSVTQSGR